MAQVELIALAEEWLKRPSGEGFLTEAEHCQTRDVFEARLEKISSSLKSDLPDDVRVLLIAVIGEIGNNSFDHNLGAWRDVPGIFFAHDQTERSVVLADRGQGIKATIERVKPTVKDDVEALRVAFTEVISGRAPERRGNGLKFVAQVAQASEIVVRLDSGSASALVNRTDGLRVRSVDGSIAGTLAVIRYQ